VFQLFFSLTRNFSLLINPQKEAAKAGGPSAETSKPAGNENEAKTDGVESSKASKEVEIPLRGEVAEEQAPPPAAAP
jgi:methionyl-tRNA synthetase